MKKFLVLSAIVGLAGIGIGVAGRGDSATQPTTVAAADVPVTVTTMAPAAEVATTTVPKPAAKTATTAAKRATSPTTAAQTQTTVTTRPTTTTTSVAVPTTTAPKTVAPSPTCALTVDYPSVKYGATQRIRFTSNTPGAKATMTIHYPEQRTDSVTSGAGNTGQIIWTFLNDTGRTAVAVTVDVLPVNGQMMTNLCSTSYQSLATSD